MTKNIQWAVVTAMMALGLSACSTAPVSNDMNTASIVPSVPESGPLVQPPAMATNTALPSTSHYNTQPAVRPAPTPAPQPAYTPAPAYQAPAAPATNTNNYMTPTANKAPAATNNYSNYTDYSAPASANATNKAPASTNTAAGGSASYYDSYASNTYSTGNTGSAPATTTSHYDYSASTGGSTATASTGSASGPFAVQVLASGHSAKAANMRQEMAALGLNAVVDQVGGLYKVRIPFASKAEASKNLSRIRSMTGESGAFITSR